MASARRTTLLLALLTLSVATLVLARKKPEDSTPDSQRKRVIHALNRLTFGPRPGDVERVTALGLDKWIDRQLHPESIEDHQVEARLASFRTLGMSTAQLTQEYPAPAVIRRIAEGKQPLPRDPQRRATYEALVDRYRERQREQAVETDAAVSDNSMLSMAGSPTKKSSDAPADGTKAATQNPQPFVAEELMGSKILRATYSERQLQEVMTDFWLNHFNVFIGKGTERVEMTSYERDVIRPRALGKFEDLLVATAQSPAMLQYLDNWLSVGPESEFARGTLTREQKKKLGGRPRPTGLNENYGRELMELHTLGVNGGYTQKDVTEVAKVFTGWTVAPGREGRGFEFVREMHQPGDKTVLGHRIKASGQKEGLEVLHILAHRPATARFISTKLAMRFVSDNPPVPLVDRMAETFMSKGGDIREVLKTMLESPDFWQGDTYRAKIKTPLEFVISALRASGANIDDAKMLAGQLHAMGMPLYGAQPPTGYSMKAEAWVSSAALTERMNFALRLASGKIRGVQVLPPETASTGQADGAERILADLEKTLLQGDISPQTHDTIASRLGDPVVSQRKLDDPARPPDGALIEGLLLGSPEFQRR